MKITPVSFLCHMCGLRRESPAELAVAGVPKQWDLPDLDAPDFVARDWEDYG